MLDRSANRLSWTISRLLAIIKIKRGLNKLRRLGLLSKSITGLSTSGKETHMLWTLAVILVILWLLGLVTSYTMGGLIHILLVVALVMVLVNFISGRKRA